MTRKGFEHRGFPDNARCRRCLLLVGAIAALLLTMPAASASRGDRLGHAADAVVDAGIPGVVVYVRDKGRTTVVTRGYDDVGAKRPMSVEDRFLGRERDEEFRRDDRAAVGGGGQALARRQRRE